MIENPLPEGMRDVLPPKARRQSRVGSRVMRSFELSGYGRVWLPMFEYARVLERAQVHAGSALRFVEPASGDVVALRSDMTPQVARVVSTRYRGAPLPIRLCYQGSVLRRRHERARTEGQLIQAGAELVGGQEELGDLEVIQVLTDAVSEAGLREFVLDIGHAAVSQSLLGPLPEVVREQLVDALLAKDVAMLEQRAREATLPDKDTRALAALTELHGTEEVWPAAERVLHGTAAAAPAARLRALHERVSDAGLAPRVAVDLGEVRGFDYYTGLMFQVLALGPGEPIASGGRYDGLYERFGVFDMGAAGFAVDINNLCWALETAEVSDPSYPKVIVDAATPAALRAALRSEGIACCAAATEPLGYAKAHGGDFVLSGNPQMLRAVTTTETRPVLGDGPEEQADHIAKLIRSGFVR